MDRLGWSMKLLDHPLLKKYFGEPVTDENIPMDKARMAYRILKAMQQPIRADDQFLILQEDETSSETSIHKEKAHGDLVLLAIHANYLKLPKPFQKD
jgi:hypothetical protein